MSTLGASTLSASVVIPTYRRRDSLVRALAALAAQTLPPDAYEVVVVIDGSDDGSREAAEAMSLPYPLRVMWQHNRGRAAACNAGARAACGDVLVLLDDDMQPVPDFVQAHVRAHAPETRRAVIGAAPVVITPALAPPAAYVGNKFNRHLERLASAGGPLTLRDFYSGNLSIRRTVFHAVGGFDESFTAYGNEDLELSLRLCAAGVELVYDAGAVAIQSYDKDFAALARDNTDKGRTAVLLSRLHPAARGELKLGSYHREPITRRAGVAMLLAATRVRPGTMDSVSRVMGWLGERRVPGVQRLYPVALDYFYWCGARAAERAAAMTGT